MKFKVMTNEVVTYWYIVEAESPESAYQQVMDNPGNPIDSTFSEFTGTIEVFDMSGNLLYERPGLMQV